MKEKIMILNAMKYVKDNKTRGRVGFIILKPSDSDNYKGYSDVACYYDVKEDFINNFSKELFLEPVVGIFEDKPSYGSSLNTRKILKSVEFKGNVISIL